MNAVGIAAATESTVWSFEIAPRTLSSNSPKSCGFAARTTTPAPATASAFERVVSTPWRSFSSSARSARRVVATRSVVPDERSPASRDSPIFPQPRMATRSFTEADSTLPAARPG